MPQFTSLGMEVFMATNPARTTFVAATMLATAIVIAPPAEADAVSDFYKDKTVSIVIGFAVGGGFGPHRRFAPRGGLPCRPCGPRGAGGLLTGGRRRVAITRDRRTRASLVAAATLKLRSRAGR